MCSCMWQCGAQVLSEWAAELCIVWLAGLSPCHMCCRTALKGINRILVFVTTGGRNAGWGVVGRVCLASLCILVPAKQLDLSWEDNNTDSLIPYLRKQAIIIQNSNTAVYIEMQSIRAIFEILFPAEVCGRCQCRQSFTLVSNHSSAVTCPVTTMTHLPVLSGAHPSSTVGETRSVFLYIIAIKCCCGFSLLLTFAGRFYFDVSALEMPLNLKQPGGVSVKTHPPVECSYPSAGKNHIRESICVWRLSSFDGDVILSCVYNHISDIPMHSADSGYR